MVTLSPKPEDIRAARAAAGLTQEQAAELVYTPRRTWQDWERGIARMHPGLWELFRIKIRNSKQSNDSAGWVAGWVGNHEGHKKPRI